MRKAASQPNALRPLPPHPQGLCSASQPVPPALPFAARAASSHWGIFSLVQERLHQDLNFCTAAGCTTDSFCSVFLNCLFFAPTRFSFFFFFSPPNECCFLPFFICRSNQCGLLLIFHFSKYPESGLAASPIHSRQLRLCGTWGRAGRTGVSLALRGWGRTPPIPSQPTGRTKP